MAHLHLGILAYWTVNTLRHQLEAKGIQNEWTDIKRMMDTQKLVTTTMVDQYDQLITIRQCSEPTLQVTEIYNALNLFERYPAIKKAYDLSQKLSSIFRKCTSKEQAFKKLALWYNEVEDSAIDSFGTVSRSIQTHYLAILNYFNNRNTNASAEAFNAKIKSFRSSARGLRDINFFLFRLAKIYG